MRRVALLPNIVTALNLACGLFVIFKVNMLLPGTGYFYVMKTSALVLLIAAFADFIDGAIARIFNAESEFGFVFDSLADAISFGVAPSVVLLKSLSLEQGTPLSFVGGIAAMIYALCGVLRLVRFNVKSSRSKGNLIEITAQKKNFTGLPIPAAAAAIISANLFFLSPQFVKIAEMSQMVRALILSASMIVLGYFMVSRWKFPSLKALNLRLASFHLAFWAVIVAVLFLYGLLHFFPLTLLVISWGYVLLGWTFSIVRVIAGKKSKTLVDFEPDEDLVCFEDQEK